MSTYILSIDQGTTSSRAIIFDKQGSIIASAQQEFKQYFPHNGWVEHDPEEIWQTTLASCRGALEKAGLDASEITTAGITNQRETTIVWDRDTGKPIYPAIVWQDRRTASYCSQLDAEGHTTDIQQKTGLLLDAYFSGSKVRWILNEVPGARQQAETGKLAFGTVDSWLIWKLSKGQSHVTDATNASRTLLFNIHTQEWDEDLCKLLEVPLAMLPEVKDCADEFAHIHTDWLGAAIPVQGVAGDQQAALVGQACFHKGMAKSTYGTGCFVVLNTGSKVLDSHNKLLSTVAYRLNGQTTYALEGSIFVAGAAMQWLRDGIKILKHASDSERMAATTRADHGVYMVPAFTGLGAPYWDPNARGAIYGLTRDTGIEEIVSATLQSVCYQTRDLQLAMEHDGIKPDTLRVDGGMVANNWVLQFLADILNVTIHRPSIIETTALGAAYLAGLQAGIYHSLEDISEHWACQQSFSPQMNDELREKLYAGWIDAVNRTRS